MAFQSRGGWWCAFVIWVVCWSAPAFAKTHLWTDRTGKFKVEAEFVSLEANRVTLRRADSGKTVSLPLTRLSPASQALAKKLAQSAEAAEEADVEGTESADAVEAAPDAAPDADQEASDESAPAERSVAPPAKSNEPAPSNEASSAPRPRVAPNNVVNSVRGAVYRAETANQMRQLAIAMQLYQTERDRFPGSAATLAHGQPGLSWRVALLPYLEEEALYRQFRQQEPWDSEHNRALLARMPKIFQSPGADLEEGYTNYLAVVGPRSIIVPGNRGINSAQVPDGLSSTVVLVEADDTHAVPWTKPDDYAWTNEAPLAGLGNIWAGQFCVAMGDGSVRFLSAGMSIEQAVGLFTRDGGESVSLDP